MKLNLRNHPYSQCYVRKNDNSSKVDFISYTTRVISIRIEDGVRKVECTGTYSATTRKQIGWFLREYAPDLCYQTMKSIVGLGFVAI